MLDYNNSFHLFAVFDGHGGQLIAKFVANNYLNVLTNLESFKNGNIEQAIIEVNLKLDEILKYKQVNDLLIKQMPKSNELQNIQNLQSLSIHNMPIIPTVAVTSTSENKLDKRNSSMPNIAITDTIISPLTKQNSITNNKDIRDNRDSKETKDPKECKEIKEIKESKDIKDKKEIRDNKDYKETKDIKETRETKDNNQNNQNNQNKDNKDTKEINNKNKEYKDNKENKDYKDRKNIQNNTNYQFINQQNIIQNTSHSPIKNEKINCLEEGMIELDLNSETIDLDQSKIASNTGTTANIVLIKNNIMYFSNIGDSICLMYKNGKAQRINDEHKTALPSESTRITNAGKKIIIDRIEGRINLSRAIGN